METNGNGKIKITKIEKDVEYLVRDIKNVKQQVFNDIPHQIKDLKDEFYAFRISNGRWMAGILVSVILILIATIIK